MPCQGGGAGCSKVAVAVLLREGEEEEGRGRRRRGTAFFPTSSSTCNASFWQSAAARLASDQIP